MKTVYSYIFISIFLLIQSSFTVSGADTGSKLKIGDPAPEFTANDQNGNLWKSSDYVGKSNLIIYFYPVALTGG